MREAGLPLLADDSHGESFLHFGSKGVVRTLHPDLWRVDLETDEGAVLTYVPVVGPFFPELHQDGEAPSYVGYMHFRGTAHAFCWPLTYRRFLGPKDVPTDQAAQPQPERRYYHLHGYLLRHGDITMRITNDHRLVLETEQGDYIELNTQTREIRLHAPSVFVGTTEQGASQIEYEQDDSIRAYAPLVLLGSEVGDRIDYRDHGHVHIVTPQCLIGQTGQPDMDGITYLANTLLHLVSPVIKFTAAQSITLDPPRLNFGNANATERVMLGDSWMALFNAFVTLFNAHTHSDVQNGGGVSGPPTTATGPMTTAQLSDIAFVSKTGL